MATTTSHPTQVQGGGFLLGPVEPALALTPEEFTEEQRQAGATAGQFLREEILPHVEELEHQAPGVAVGLLRKAGELGLLSIQTPEKYGGLELDEVTSLLVCEHLSGYASFSTTYGSHAGIGTMPLALFGSAELKQKYLPRLATAELVAAYCLSEAHSGSDALAARTRADLDGDGRHYLLNGEKMWISNGGWADVFTVFAKVGGEKFTAFLVERAFPGVRTGAEEKKMGIKGSSTCPVILENARVPVENVLGEIGRGHIIAFNILNLGRLKLGASCVGGSKLVLATALRYAKERHAFGKSIAEFGLIQHKLAEMGIRAYVGESMVYRTGGLIDAQLGGFSWDQPDAAKTFLKAVEEYAVECSIIKVYLSEILDYVVDEAVQIHGGYGYHQDYAVERAYRDSRINRIFEGTNEINRLLISGMLVKRAVQGRLPLVAAAQAVAGEMLAGPAAGDVDDDGSPLAAANRLTANAKKIALFAAGAAYQRFMGDLENQQEVLAGLSDIIMETYAMESAVLRTAKLAAAGRGTHALDLTAVFTSDAMGRLETSARTVFAACQEGDTLRTSLAFLRRLTRREPVDTVTLRRRIAARLIEAEKYLSG